MRLSPAFKAELIADRDMAMVRCRALGFSGDIPGASKAMADYVDATAMLFVLSSMEAEARAIEVAEWEGMPTSDESLTHI